MKIYLILVFLFLTVNVLHSQGGDWTLYYTGVDNKITAIIEDQNSVIWLGTESAGLLKYEGGIFTIYNAQNSPLPGSTIWALAVDQQNNLWIATHDTGLVKYDGNNWTCYDMMQIAPKSAANSAWEVEVDDENNIWVGTYWAGLAKFDGNSWTLYDDSNSPMPQSQMEINAIAFDNLGNLWYGTDSKGFGMFDRNNYWEIYEIMTWIYCIAIESTDDVWFNGSYLAKLSSDSLWTEYQYNVQSFSNYAIAIDPNNKKWMAQEDSCGIFIVENDNFNSFYPSFPEIQDAKTYSIYIDNTNTKWIGYTNGYLLKYTGDNPVDVMEENGNLLNAFSLYQNHPNPFNPITKIRYSIPSVISSEGRNLRVTLKVYDILGREITTLVNEEKSAGTYEVEFKGFKVCKRCLFLSVENR